MFTSKLRTVLALLAAVLTVGLATGPLAPGAEAQIKSNPTGNSKLDAICQRIADLINYANSQGDLAMINDDDEGAQAWYDLADDMIRRGTNAGCKLAAGTFHQAPQAGDPTISDGGTGGTQLPPRPGVDDGAVAGDNPPASDGGTSSSGAPVFLYRATTQADPAGMGLRATKAKAKRLVRRARAIG
jgi:hypothetical protein